MERHFTTPGIVRLVALAGLATIAMAQNSQPTQPSMQNSANRQDSESSSLANRYRADYRSCHWLSDRDVVNSAREDVGDVSDMIIERGSGRVKFVILKTGTVLGMGGRTVAIPYNQFRWDDVNEQFVLNTAATNLQSYPEYTESGWQELRSSQPTRSGGWNSGRVSSETNSTTGVNSSTGISNSSTGTSNPSNSSTNPNSMNNSNQQSSSTGTSGSNASPNATPRNENIQNTQNDRNVMNRQEQLGQRRVGQPYGADGASPLSRVGQPVTFNDWMWESQNRAGLQSYGSQWDWAAKQRIEGQVRTVSREYAPGQGEQIIVELQAQDGTTKKVALGPTWYVAGHGAGINRGDRITVDAVPIYVATSTQVNGKELALRSEKGTPAWSDNSFRSGDSSYSSPYYQHVLLSDLRGAELDCRGTECGKVNDVIIDAGSGSIAFLSIDPNVNFLGIGDTKRLVPWSVATVGVDGTVRIDTTKEMMTASPETPSDFKTLSAAGGTDAIYRAYQVPPRSDDDFRRSTWSEENYNSYDSNRIYEPMDPVNSDRTLNPGTTNPDGTLRDRTNQPRTGDGTSPR